MMFFSHLPPPRPQTLSELNLSADINACPQRLPKVSGTKLPLIIWLPKLLSSPCLCLRVSAARTSPPPDPGHTILIQGSSQQEASLRTLFWFGPHPPALSPSQFFPMLNIPGHETWILITPLAPYFIPYPDSSQSSPRNVSVGLIHLRVFFLFPGPFPRPSWEIQSITCIEREHHSDLPDNDVASF